MKLSIRGLFAILVSIYLLLMLSIMMYGGNKIVLAGIFTAAMICICLAIFVLVAKPIKTLSAILDTQMTPPKSCDFFSLSEFDLIRTNIMSSFQALKTRSEELNALNAELEKRVSDELVKSRQKDYILIQQSKLATMGEMINAIAHQWRQPLNSLGLGIQDIKYAYEKNEIDKHYVDNVVKESMSQIKYMSKTIDDFRNFYKPNKEKKLFGINEALRGSLSLVRSRLEAHFFKITELYDDSLPQINGYENEFKQAILNIISNTQDAADDNKVESPSITIKSGFEGGYALIEIEDNCGGIAESVINRVFEPYFTTKEQGKGTGIGLFMSRTIIEENMNGIIEVLNIPNGAKFIVKLPVI